MAMEVILRDHVEHLGRRGDVVKVANGYARNYLLPRRLALAVTAENQRQIARERVKAEARDAEELAAADVAPAAPAPKRAGGAASSGGGASASSASRRSTTSTTRT